MEKWIFIPKKMIGEIEFGMQRDLVRKKLGIEYKEFMKNELSKNSTDDYGNFHIYYDIKNQVEAVEIFEGIEVVFEDNTIFPTSINSLKQVFPNIEIIHDNYTDIDNSIGISIEDDKIFSILFGKESYYNNQLIDDNNEL